ncbi:MAG TPA: DUF2568 domain-containing protein [Candidatus Nanopelagicales bacterium]|jgi:hypothetical protein|nr:DUF2568 domain-containing protein [Candidatus Nanopelagicales bacterium]
MADEVPAGPVDFVVATVVFLVELAALAGLALLGWATTGPDWTRVALTVLLPVVAAGLWGTMLSPRAARPLPDLLRLGLRAVVLVAGAAGYWAAGLVTVTVTMLVGVVVATAYDRRVARVAGSA